MPIAYEFEMPISADGDRLSDGAGWTSFVKVRATEAAIIEVSGPLWDSETMQNALERAMPQLGRSALRKLERSGGVPNEPVMIDVADLAR